MKTKCTILTRNSFAKLLILAISLVFSTQFAYSQIGINMDNSAPDASAMLDVKATGLGLLVPRMTVANRPATPATGLMIYQTNSDPGYYYYDGAAWQKIGRKADNLWASDGADIYNTNADNIYIGTSSSDGNRLNVMNYITGRSAVHGMEQSGVTLYSEGMLGLLNWPGNPLGLPIDVANVGVFGRIPGNGLEGAAVYGWNKDDNLVNYGGIFVADGENSNTNYAIYADADSANTNYAGYFKGRVRIIGNNVSDGASDSTQTVLYARVGLNGGFYDTRAIEGYSHSRPGYGVGVYGSGGYKGVQGATVYDDYTGTSYGVFGSASGSAGTRIGLYGTASGGTTNWAGYFSGDVYVSSDVRIGTTAAATGYSLSVNGKIACEELLIDDSGFWPDYVFDNDYALLTIDEFEESINENNHLPGMPSAQEIVENGGHHVGDIQKKTLEKVEELSLYIIELNNRVKYLEKENQDLKVRMDNQ